MSNWNPMDWGTPQGMAIFFVSIAVLLASIGVLLWGISQLI